MNAVTLSFFRFGTAGTRLRAFGEMGFARPALTRLAGLGFYKLLGTGTGEGFTPRPDFSVYAVLGAWDSRERAREQIASGAAFGRFRERADESWTLHMTPLRCWGRWAGCEPFDTVERPVAGPVAVLTRATLKPRRAVQFWRWVPKISRRIGANSDVLFKQGLGEVPMLNQVTFSIWPDLGTMTQFAYGNGPHIEAIRQVRAQGWFREELYARFAIDSGDGCWGGRDPLAISEPAGKEAA